MWIEITSDKFGIKDRAAGRILFIDSARGMAILMIVMSHVIRRGILTDYLGSVGVVMFFFLGGLVVSREHWQEIKQYWKTRFRRLYVPYLAVGLFSIVVYAVLGKTAAGALAVSAGDTDILRAFLHLLYANSKNGAMKWNDSLWFVPAYLVVLTLAAGVEKIIGRCVACGDGCVRKKAVPRILISAMTMFVGIFFSQRLGWTLPWQTETAMEMLPFYEAGILIREICQGTEDIGWNKGTESTKGAKSTEDAESTEGTEGAKRIEYIEGIRKVKGADSKREFEILPVVLSLLLIVVSAVLTGKDIAVSSDGTIMSAMSVRADVYPDLLLSFGILAIAGAAFSLLAKGMEEYRVSCFLARFGRYSMEIMLWNKFFVLAVQLLLKKTAPQISALVLQQSSLTALVLSIPAAILCAEGCILLNRILQRSVSGGRKMFCNRIHG